MKKEREQITIRLPSELKEKLQRKADERGVTLNDQIIIVVWDYLKHIFQG